MISDASPIKSLVLRTTFLLSGVIYVLLFFSTPMAWPIAKKPTHELAKNQITELTSSLSLRDCYYLALKRSEAIAIRKEEIEETEAEFLKTAGEILGDADFVITDFRQDAAESKESSGGSSVGGTLTARDRQERKFVISQPLFQGFRSIAALGAVGSLRKQRTQERLRAEQLLFLDVAQAFYNLLKQKQEVEIIETIHKSLEERISELKEREKIGRSRASEVATATSRMKIIESELAQSRGALAVAQHLLEFLIGTSFELNQLKDEPLPEETTLALDDYLQSSEMRHDVEASKQAMKIAWRSVIEAQSEFWPEITLDSNVYQKREGFQKDIDWDVLFKINVPLSRGGENLGNVKQALSRWKKSKLNYSLTKRQADLNIKETYQNWHASFEETGALREAVQASEENFNLQKDEYSRNLVSNLDVLEALQELYSAKRQANQTYYDMKVNYWHLQVAGGVFDELI